MSQDTCQYCGQAHQYYIGDGDGLLGCRNRLAERVASLTSEWDRLREALKPFADIADSRTAPPYFDDAFLRASQALKGTTP